MLAQGFLNPIDTARARLQEQIGLFLSGRAKLLRMIENPSLTIQGQARGLYAVQQQLEIQLQNEMMPKIQAISTGVWNSSDALKIGWFTKSLMDQISNVRRLEQQAGGVTPSFFDNVDMSTVAIGGIILVGVGIMSGVLFGRRQTTQV
jgi:hypothetical protein